MFPPLDALTRPRITELTHQLVKKNFNWFAKNKIDVVKLPECSILSYQRGEKPEADNHWNILANGIVISDQGEVWSFPMSRMHALGTKTHLTLSGSDLSEKMDGKLVCVCFPSKNLNKPMIHTKKAAWYKDWESTCNEGEMVILREAKRYISKAIWNFSDAESTTMFELVTEYSQTKYRPERHGLYLIGQRSVTNFKELDEGELDNLATRMQVERPEIWFNISGWSGIEEITKELGSHEGFVARCNTTGERVKIQQKHYISRNQEFERLLKFRRRLPLLLENKLTDYEFKDKFTYLKDILDKKVEFAMKIVDQWKPLADTLTKSQMLDRFLSSPDPRWIKSILMAVIHIQSSNQRKDLIQREILRITHGIYRRIEGLETGASYG